ncbi:BglG family transcription antiterminator [Jeotgalibaca porci]|uniref:BglG family transcription antiterminator n=1 Tax=Jeotgalibaca porci TaxID=1868793 RepID=UPI003F91E604
MREKLLVDLLLKYKEPLSLSYIAEKLDFSESTIRKLIKDTNMTSKHYGFEIILQKGKGYTLEILDSEKLEHYRNELRKEIDVLDIDQRLESILFYILQTDDYLTIEELIELIGVSRSTVLKDLDVAERKLQEYNLYLERKPHYGLRVQGKELDFRRAFSKHVIHSTLYLEPTVHFKNFLKTNETKKISEYFRNVLDHYNLSVSEVIFQNISTHLKIVLFRAMQQNYIKKDQVIIKNIDAVYQQVADDMAAWIKEEYKLILPKEEVLFLAAHISAKSSTKKLDDNENNQMYQDIKEILSILDDEFLTRFSNDSELVENLVLHIYPLLDRLYYNLQLENPLIDEMKLKYTNVLVVSFRFGELIERKYGYMLTRDEIGYIALHLAAHFEKEKQQLLEKIKRIVVICSTGGGSAHLIRLKLEKLFSSAVIMTVANRNLDMFREDLPDLFLATIPLEDEFEGVPIIQIKNFLDDIEIKHIMDITTQQISARKIDSGINGLEKLFSNEYFTIRENGNYLEIIKEQADKMVKNKVTSEDFTGLVMERESRFSTVYDKGIAGPHPIKLNGKNNIVGVTILRKPIRWQDKEVKIIFLINLKKGHLFLHKEISKFLAMLMNNEQLIDRLVNIATYGEFITEIKTIMTEEYK